MMSAYWAIGKILYDAMSGTGSNYGKQLIKFVSVKLSEKFGKGFCFVARQKRITIHGNHYYVDLVFYNYILKCFVLIDLKTHKLTY